MLPNNARRPQTAAAAEERARLSADDRRQRILKAAREVFVESGLKARTKDIAVRAGVAEGLIFHRFGSKEELFRVAVLEPLEQLVAELVERASTFAAAPAGQRQRQSEQAGVELLTAMVDIAPLLGTALFADAAQGKAFWLERLVPLFTAGEDAVEDALGGWRASPLPNGKLFIAMFGMHLALALDHHFTDDPMDVDELGAAVTRFVVRSILGELPAGTA